MHKDRDTGTWVESYNALHRDGGSPWNDPGTTTDYVVAGDWIEIVADMAGNLHVDGTGLLTLAYLAWMILFT